MSDNDGRLTSVSVDGEQMWLATELAADADALRPQRRVLALPGFDELILGFKDRRLHIPEGRFDDIVPGGNGIFRSTIVADGVVQATWSRTLTPRRSVKVTVVRLRSRRAASAARSAPTRRSWARAALLHGRRLRQRQALLREPHTVRVTVLSDPEKGG